MGRVDGARRAARRRGPGADDAGRGDRARPRHVPRLLRGLPRPHPEALHPVAADAQRAGGRQPRRQHAVPRRHRRGGHMGPDGRLGATARSSPTRRRARAPTWSSARPPTSSAIRAGVAPSRPSARTRTWRAGWRTRTSAGCSPRACSRRSSTWGSTRRRRTATRSPATRSSTSGHARDLPAVLRAPYPPGRRCVGDVQLRADQRRLRLLAPRAADRHPQGQVGLRRVRRRRLARHAFDGPGRQRGPRLGAARALYFGIRAQERRAGRLRAEGAARRHGPAHPAPAVPLRAVRAAVQRQPDGHGDDPAPTPRSRAASPSRAPSCSRTPAACSRSARRPSARSPCSARAPPRR